MYTEYRQYQSAAFGIGLFLHAVYTIPPCRCIVYSTSLLQGCIQDTAIHKPPDFHRLANGSLHTVSNMPPHLYGGYCLHLCPKGQIQRGGCDFPSILCKTSRIPPNMPAFASLRERRFQQKYMGTCASKSFSRSLVAPVAMKCLYFRNSCKPYYYIFIYTDRICHFGVLHCHSGWLVVK